MKKITRTQILNEPIPVPPLEEQNRLTERLASEYSLLERARAAAAASLRAARQLRVAALRRAFQSGRAREWARVSLGDASEIVSGITLGRPPSERKTRLVPYLRVANVKDGHLDLSNVYQIEATDPEIERLRLKPGDLLLTEGGDRDKLGRGTFWQDQISDCIHQNHIFRVRFDFRSFSPSFVAAQLASPYGRAYFLAHAKQTTGIATINRGVLAAFPLLAPALSEQVRVSESVYRQIAEAEHLCAALSAGSAAVDSLRPALLTRAFSGGL